MPNISIKKTFKTLNGDIVKIKDSTGKEEILTLGMVLADVILAPHQNKDGFRPLKSLELAKKFYGEEAKNKEVEIDLADFVQIKELVEENKNYITIITAQALQMLNDAEISKK